MARLGQRLAEEFGRGFEAKNLRRMVQFAQAFADPEKVASLMRPLSWTHFLQLIPVKTDAARWFYAQQCVEARWSVRELHRQIERKAHERSEIADARPSGLPSSTDASPTHVFKDRTSWISWACAKAMTRPILKPRILRQLEAHAARASSKARKSPSGKIQG